MSEGCSLYAIRVAHENSLSSAQAVVKTKSYIHTGLGNYDSIIKEDVTKINLRASESDTKNLKNLSSYLTFYGSEHHVYTMINEDVPLTPKQVYQIDPETGKKSDAITKYCLALSDVLSGENIAIYSKSSSTPIDPSLYETDWFYGEGKNRASAVVFNLEDSPLAVNELADISFDAKQQFVQNTGSTNASDVYCYMQYKSGISSEIVFSDPVFVIE